MGVDNKYFFLRKVAPLLIQSGLHRVETAKHSVKFGLIHENGNEYIVPYYDIPLDACASIIIKKYDKNFVEIESKEYYSEDDACDYLDCLKELKESPLNKELSDMFSEIISFINYKDKDAIIN